MHSLWYMSMHHHKSSGPFWFMLASSMFTNVQYTPKRQAWFMRTLIYIYIYRLVWLQRIVLSVLSLSRVVDAQDITIVFLDACGASTSMSWCLITTCVDAMEMILLLWWCWSATNLKRTSECIASSGGTRGRSTTSTTLTCSYFIIFVYMVSIMILYPHVILVKHGRYANE